jgi:hypothetical protein
MCIYIHTYVHFTLFVNTEALSHSKPASIWNSEHHATLLWQNVTGNQREKRTLESRRMQASYASELS